MHFQEGHGGAESRRAEVRLRVGLHDPVRADAGGQRARAAGTQFNQVPKSVPKIVPKSVPNSPCKIIIKKSPKMDFLIIECSEHFSEQFSG